GDLGMNPDRAAPFLLCLLGLGPGSELLPGLSPEAVKKGTFETLREMILRDSRRMPRVIAVEDVHWSDPTSDEFLLGLAERIALEPVLLLMTYRPGHRPEWLTLSHATQIALRRLQPDASLRVASSLLAGTDAAVVATIADRAEGNPFFLEELARAAQ